MSKANKTNPYKVKLVQIESRRIYNMVGPYSIDHFEIDKKIREAQDYKGKRQIDKRNSKDLFFEKLEASVLTEGLRNPVLVIAGWLHPGRAKYVPEEVRADPKKLLICNFIGGSRLHVAQKNDLTIPCMVSDFTNMFPDEEHLESLSAIKKCFPDPPKIVAFETWGLRTSVPLIKGTERWKY